MLTDSDGWDDDSGWFHQEQLEQRRREEEALAQQKRIDQLKIQSLTEMYKWIDSTRDETCKV